MKKEQRRKTTLCMMKGLITFILLSIMCGSAYGYVLTASQLLEQTTKKFARAKTMKLIQKVTLYDEQFQDGKISLSETSYYHEPDLFRSEIRSKDTKKIQISSFYEALIIIDDKIVSELERGFDHYKDLIAFKDRVTLQKRLQILGVDTSKTRLELLDGKAVYVIGKRPRYGDLFPQLYIDKTTFLPQKWIIKGVSQSGAKSDSMEVSYHDWRKHGGMFVPARVTFYKNKTLVKDIVIEKIAINKGVSDILFNFDVIRTRFASPDKDDKDSTTTDEQNETNKVIEGLDRIIKDDRLAF